MREFKAPRRRKGLILIDHSIRYILTTINLGKTDTTLVHSAEIVFRI